MNDKPAFRCYDQKCGWSGNDPNIVGDGVRCCPKCNQFVTLFERVQERNGLENLLERLKESRYAISVTLTGEERRAQPEPTYGGKGTSRWLTEEEHSALIAALEAATK